MILSEQQKHDLNYSMINIKSKYAKAKAEVIMKCTPSFIFNKQSKEFIKIEYPDHAKKELELLESLEIAEMIRLLENYGIKVSAKEQLKLF